jgi:hypothetical protein
MLARTPQRRETCRKPYQSQFGKTRKTWRSSINARLADELSRAHNKFVMNTSDIYVRYEACEMGEHKSLQVFARVPRAKIREFQQASDDPTFSDEDIAKILATRPAENRLCQLRAYWSGVSCLTAPPAELREREPDFREIDGMELWAIEQKAA